MIVPTNVAAPPLPLRVVNLVLTVDTPRPRRIGLLLPPLDTQLPKGIIQPLCRLRDVTTCTLQGMDLIIRPRPGEEVRGMRIVGGERPRLLAGTIMVVVIGLIGESYLFWILTAFALHWTPSMS